MFLYLFYKIKKTTFFLLFAILFMGGLRVEAQHISKIIFEDDDGQLTYISDIEGNRIPDYSHAGYNNGMGELPEVPVKIELNPKKGDNTKQIQDAINTIASLPPDENGIRGAVLLRPGEYVINRNLFINDSGVVLRGAGDGSNPENSSIIVAEKNIKETVLQIGDERPNWYKPLGSTVQITSEFITVGSRVFEVEDASAFEVGDNIILRHRSFQDWLDAIDGGGTAGAEPWEPAFIDIFYSRNITDISENTIEIDAPVYNHLDRSLTETIVYKQNRKHLVTNSGVESLRIKILTNGENSNSHAENGILFRGVENGWANKVTVLHFKNSGFVTHTSSRITIKDSKALEPHSTVTSSKRYNFNAWYFSNNILFTNVISSNARRDFVSNGTSVVSGIVFHNSLSKGALGASEGHQKWSQALLYDNIKFEDPLFYNVLGLYNRGNLGSSHGWASVHSTAWNIQAEDSYIYVQKPPTAQNYAIANQSNVLGGGLFEHPPGFIEGTNKTPEFESLYTKQLEDRLVHGIPPDMPNRFMASNKENNKVVLRWDYLSAKPSKVILERSQIGNEFERIAILDKKDSVYVDNTVLEAEYRYRIYSENEGRRSAIALSDNIIPKFSEEVISDFEVVTPDTGTNINVRGEPDQVLNFSWSKGESRLDISYSLIMEFEESNQFESFFKADSLDQTNFSFTYAELDSLLNANDIKVGESIDLRVRVKGTSKTVEKFSDNIVKIQLQRDYLGTLNDFSLLKPIDNQLIKVQGNKDDELFFSWEEAVSDLEVSYDFLIDLPDRDFSEPIYKKESLKNLNYSFSYERLDSLLQEQSIKKGSELEIKWKVRASTLASEKYSTNILRRSLYRGNLYRVPNFSLIEPLKNLEFNISGLSTETIEFKWEDVVDTNEFSYSWYLDYLDEDFSDPLIKIDSISQNNLSISYADLDSLINAAGIPSTDILRAKWAVRIEKDVPVKWSLDENPINLKRGVIVDISDFSLQEPNDNTVLSLIGDRNQSIQFTWQKAISNAEISYTLLLDEVEGDFSSPMLVINSIESEDVVFKYDQMDDLLTQKGVRTGEEFKAKWSVLANSDHADKMSEQTSEITFIKGALFEGSASLDQNYPNPFNISTNIRYHLSAGSDVVIQIYNSSGALVARFDEGSKSKGTHSIQFDAASLSSGLYFLKLLTDDQIRVKKMTLIK